MIGREDWTGWT